MRKKWKKLVSLLMSTTMTVGMLAAFTPALVANANEGQEIQKQFYVSAKGNDKNDGSKKHPFATVEKAREEVDKINDDMSGNIIVNIESGDYFINETIQMDKNDSGTNGFEVIYQCDGEPGTARLIGGRKVVGWEKTTQEDVKKYDMSGDMLGKVYKIKLDENTPDFNTMYINGERATMARTPDRIDNARFPAAEDEYILSTRGSANGIAFPKEALSQEEISAVQNALNRGEEGAQIYGWDWDYRNWMTSTIPVAGISEDWIQFEESRADKPVENRPKYPFGGGARFILQGNLAFLDSPGEYHYNKKEKVLYYYPQQEEENLDEQEIIVPYVQEIVALNGDEKEKVTDVPNPDEQVHNITFKGLEMGYTEFTDSYSSCWNAFDAYGVGVYPEEALQEGITQPSYCEVTEREEFRKGIITLSRTNHITVDSVRLVNAGLSGVNAWGDNDHITVKNCEIADIGLYGICVDGGYPGPNTGCYSYGHLITNNVIHGLGALAGHATGVQIAQVHDSEFSHMEIYDAARRAIGLNGAWANRTEQDSQFNRFRDTHSYDNHLEYLYLHDLQQDGGDDGALFMCTLYGSWGDITGDRPNYLNQVYMDNVGSSASNKDFKANCINFDMGCAGVQVSNVKAVNPQHYNIRHDGEVDFDNVNIGYFDEPEHSNYKNFDESKMEYDKIGVDETFPYKNTLTESIGKKDKADGEYKDLYFREEFDNGLENWWTLAGTPQTSPLYYSDNDDWTGNSFLADAFYNSSSTGCRIGKPFGTDLNKIVEIDFFDHMCDAMEDGYCGKAFQWKLDSFARVDNGTSQRAIGVDHNTNGQYYSYRIGNFTRATNVEREYGWHTFKWDYTSGTDVKMYIDDKLIASFAADGFNYIEMGDYGMGGFNAYDNVVIYDGAAAPDPIPLPEPPKPEEPEINKTLPGILEADEADELPKGSQVCNNPEATGGKTVGYLVDGGIFKFHVNAQKDFSLPLTVHYAANKVNAGFKMLLDGEEVQDVKFDVAQGWDTMLEYTTENPIQVTKGEHEIQLIITDQNFGLDWIGFLEEEPDKLISVESIQPAIEEKMILALGNAVRVPVQILPANAENKTLIWSTDDEDGDVITVTEDGTITAKGVGTATVMVVSQDNAEAKAQFNIEVQDTEESLISTKEKGCTPEVSSYWDERYTADKLIDGKLNTEWVSGTPLQEDPKPTATLSWDTPQTVKTICVYDRPNANDWTKEVDVYINDEETVRATIQEIPNDGKAPGVLAFEKPVEDVTSIKFIIDKEKNGGGALALSEIKVYESAPGEIPVSGIAFDENYIAMFENGTYTLNIPKAVPDTATNSAIKLEIAEGEEFIRMTPNIMDGVIKNYTITALKAGRTVIRASASNGVYEEFVVEVVDREPLADKIIEAENLYGMYPNEAEAGRELRKVIDKAIEVYNSSENAGNVKMMIEELQDAIETFIAAVEVKTDKTLLQKTYDYALTLATDGVTESAVKFFEEAKREAKAVLDDTKATQEEVDAVWNKLLKGIWGLGLYQGDKTNLGILIQKAEFMMQNEERYVQDKWNDLVEALTKANEVMKDGNALEEDIEPAADALLKAILEQRLKANKSNLEDLINKAETIDLSKYTKESVETFLKAFDEAKVVMRNDNLSVDDQKVVNEVANKLQAAMKGLKLVSNENSDSENHEQNSSDFGTEKDLVSSESPKTGDNTQGLLMLFCMMIALTAGGIAATRKCMNRVH